LTAGSEYKPQVAEKSPKSCGKPAAYLWQICGKIKKHNTRAILRDIYSIRTRKLLWVYEGERWNTMQKLIYVADDEKNIRNLVKAFLEKESYKVEAFENGDLLLEAFAKKECDLAILDIMMPGNNGFIVCAKLRAISKVPIVMLTAKDTEDDYISGLSLGSDDYFTKPFSPVKLTIRVKAILRREDMYAQNAIENTTPESKEITFEDIKICHNRLTANCGDSTLSLTKTEFNFLVYLIENKEKAVSRQELLNAIWGYDNNVESRATDDTVKRLRRKLYDAKSNVSIETVWGYGFKIGKVGTVKI